MLVLFVWVSKCYWFNCKLVYINTLWGIVSVSLEYATAIKRLVPPLLLKMMHWSVHERLTIWFFSLLSFTLISSVCCETQNKRTILMIIKILQTPISPYLWISLHPFNIILALTLRPLNICTDKCKTTCNRFSVILNVNLFVACTSDTYWVF